MRTRIRGLHAAIVTPLTPQARVDFSMFDRLCAFALERGAGGVCIGGATSEYPRFEMAERLQLVQHAVRSAPRGIVVLAAIGSPSLEGTIALGRAAFEAGCAAVLLPMPYFFRYEQGDLAEYCEYVADTLEGPCLLYDLPDFTNPLEPETAIHLMASAPRIVGIKDSSGRAGHLVQLSRARSGRDWTLLAGDDSLGLAAAEAGWDGAVSGLACCCPELLAALHGSLRDGNLDRARRYQGLVDELIAHLALLPTPWGIRAALKGRGLDTGPLPLPVSRDRAAQIGHVEAWLPRWLAGADIPNLQPAV
jgi:4-hydroxy-tetrahydrodipicolinate synthase